MDGIFGKVKAPAAIQDRMFFRRSSSKNVADAEAEWNQQRRKETMSWHSPRHSSSQHSPHVNDENKLEEASPVMRHSREMTTPETTPETTTPEFEPTKRRETPERATPKTKQPPPPPQPKSGEKAKNET